MCLIRAWLVRCLPGGDGHMEAEGVPSQYISGVALIRRMTPMHFAHCFSSVEQ